MNLKLSYGWALAVLTQIVFYLTNNYDDLEFTKWVIIISLCMFTLSHYLERIIYVSGNKRSSNKVEGKLKWW